MSQQVRRTIRTTVVEIIEPISTARGGRKQQRQGTGKALPSGENTNKPLTRGNIVKVIDGWRDRPGGPLSATGLFKLGGFHSESGKWRVDGLLGTDTEGTGGWMRFSEIRFVADDMASVPHAIHAA